MKKYLCLLLFLGLGSTAVADLPSTNKEITLTGTFNWTGKKGSSEDLNAVLTPSGTNEWKAVFTFLWDKAPHTYTGMIKGHLDNGDVTGEATADGGGRTFGFKGRATNHQITFSHFETTGKKSAPTGSGTLKPGPLKALDKPGPRRK